ncbi:hypothetical protein [Natronorubrum daqingense]|uniref:DUF7978 domain-containing protein n=1 Tax=Natronorubrum daqingense TaxID=588898 RepID=A0A1N7F0X1_9EURY|nr:hypothetical protein [Natronorubrum daqingense]APX97458.1 hypothetical protein BB347_13050 [Natronorubrum daqingense]SIR93882.1 hypothetical protein SAMN05421809_2923 [Natronorubrum daqingense]
MSRLATANDGPASRGSSVAASAGLGVLAAAIGYLASYVLIIDEAREAVGDGVADWKGVAWYFYNAHLVDIETSGEFGAWGGTDTANLIAESGSTSATLLYVLPPLVLFTIGAILAAQWHVNDIGGAVLAAAPVTIGYAVVLSIGAHVAESSSEGTFGPIEMSGSVAPELLPAILLAGILYPLVFATAGAVLASTLTGR